MSHNVTHLYHHIIVINNLSNIFIIIVKIKCPHCSVTSNVIKWYAQNKQFGFAYKEYPDLPGEVWKEIKDSENAQGRWKISDMNRVKYITKYAENVLSNERIGLMNGYPTIAINGKHLLCHILSFMAFFPEEYASKKLDEGILHEDDNKMDFRPHQLRLGTQKDNGKDAHDNGKYDGTKTERVKCASYIDNVLEKEHDSKRDAVRYLTLNGHPKATHGNISMAMSGIRKSAYGRSWKLV